jgi:hypothetical protein
MTDQSSDLAATLSARTIAVQLEIKRLGVRKKVPTTAIKVRGQTEETTDPDALRVSKELISCPEYDAILSLDSAFRSRLLKRAVPSMLRRGVYLVPVDLIERIDREIRAYQTTRETLVDTFVLVYGAAVDDAKARLSTLFDPADYPPKDDVRRAFDVRVQYVSFDVPASLERLSATVFERERSKLQASMQSAADEVRTYLRKGLLDLVAHLHDRLTPDPATGKPKIIRESTVESFQDWLSLFEYRNVTDDAELEQLVNQCRRALDGADAPSLRKDDKYREQLSAEMAGVKDSLGKMIVDRPARKFAWDDAA